jgi:hypothetical protein
VEAHCAAWTGKERERKREEEKKKRKEKKKTTDKKKEGKKIEKINYLFLEIVICNLY